ncbi:MAG: ester cyclase [Pseudomonadales bacterium]
MKACAVPERIRNWIECINSQDIEKLASHMSADHTFFVEGEEPTVGIESNQQAWSAYFSAFPNYKIHIDSAYEDHGVFYLLGHTKGSHVPADLESIPESVIWKATLEADTLSEWIIFDGTRRHSLGISNDV